MKRIFPGLRRELFLKCVLASTGLSFFIFLGCGVKSPPIPYIETYPEVPPSPSVVIDPVPSPSPVPSVLPKGKKTLPKRKK